MKITNDIKYVGVNDHEIDLFEGQFIVPNGMSYNSYLILDEKIAVMDSVDANFGDQWIANIKEVLGDKSPDYLVVHHMEMDHSANIAKFMEVFPNAKIVSSKLAFVMMKNYFGTDFA
ncbi:MAG: FprA family A-type flavoprotein, partial [Spirochaetaceae bacterium]|nr:FprA family A-type flavoprotein [Spirochaetaceae bacterium]